MPSARYGLVVGRLAFPTPSVALPVTRLTYEVFPAHAAVHIREEWSCTTFMALALLQSASVCAGFENPPLMRFILSVPLYRFSNARPLQGSKLPVGRNLPQLQHGPPSWFRTTSAVYSAHRLAGLLRPATGSGVRYVSASGRPRSNRSYRVALLMIPATRFTPLEEFPSFAAVLHHCSRCPLVVTLHSTPHETPRCFMKPGACSEERGGIDAEALMPPQLCGAPSWQARMKFSSR